MVTEDTFLSKIIPLLSKNNLLPSNDDAIAWKTPKNESNSLLVLNIDSIAWSTDALPDTMSLFDFGMKLVTVTVSDVITKGSKPYYFLSTITIPDNIPDTDLLDLFNGLLEGCKRYNLEYMGGDLGKSKELVLSGVVIGYVKENLLLKRSTIKEQDLICVTGFFGYTGLGFKYYLEKSTLVIPSAYMDVINDKMLKPKARLDWLSLLQNYANATIDSSDGLAKSLQHLVEESNKQIQLEYLPAFPELEKILEKDSDDYIRSVLYAGEEFEIIFTISEQNYKNLLEEITKNEMQKPIIIGRATKGQAKVFYKGIELPDDNNWDSFNGFQK